MKEQKVRVLVGIDDIEKRINDIIKEMNSDGWVAKQICSHYSRQSYWWLLFERTTKK